MDSTDIVNIYCQRPGAVAHMGLGEWFARAHQIKDRELELCLNVKQSISIILNKGYDVFELYPLVTYNKELEHVTATR